MTNYEANNSSTQSTPVGHSWNWLSERLPLAGVEQLGNWMHGELQLLEADYVQFVTERSLKRDLRQEFKSSTRITD